MPGISHEPTLTMEKPDREKIYRHLTLIAVLCLHAAVLSLLIMGSRASLPQVSASTPIQVTVIPPATLPKIRAENSRPRLSGSTAISIAAPVLDSHSSSLYPFASVSGSDGSGSGVNWAAEARRAVRAFDIRSHQPPVHDALSSTPADDDWWPHTQHHAGDQYKIANGDWIVWINASCYQVAGSGPPAYASEPGLPRTVCPQNSAGPGGNSTAPAADPPRAAAERKE